MLKTLMAVAIILALAEPRLEVSETKVAAAVLVDTSSSVSSDDLRACVRPCSRNSIPLAAGTGCASSRSRGSRASLRDSEHTRKLESEAYRGDGARGTDLEAAVRDAARLSSDADGAAVLLISDGNENEGSVARAAWMARQLGIPIDTYAMRGQPAPLLRIESITVPSIAFSRREVSGNIECELAPKKTIGDSRACPPKAKSSAVSQLIARARAATRCGCIRASTYRARSRSPAIVKSPD